MPRPSAQTWDWEEEAFSLYKKRRTKGPRLGPVRQEAEQVGGLECARKRGI